MTARELKVGDLVTVTITGTITSLDEDGVIVEYDYEGDLISESYIDLDAAGATIEHREAVASDG